MYPLVVFAPMIGLAVYCATQLLLSHLLLERSPYVSLVAGMVIGLITNSIITVLPLCAGQSRVEDIAAWSVLNFFTCFALAFGYFCFVNLNLTSLRIRLLSEIARSGGRVKTESLLAKYNTDNVIDIRFERLIAGGDLLERHGRYFIGKMRFLFLARLYAVLRWTIIGSGTTPGSKPVQ